MRTWIQYFEIVSFFISQFRYVVKQYILKYIIETNNIDTFKPAKFVNIASLRLGFTLRVDEEGVQVVRMRDGVYVMSVLLILGAHFHRTHHFRNVSQNIVEYLRAFTLACTVTPSISCLNCFSVTLNTLLM